MPETLAMGLLLTLLVFVCCGFYFIQLEELQSTQTSKLSVTNLDHHDSLKAGEQVRRPISKYHCSRSHPCVL